MAAAADSLGAQGRPSRSPTWTRIKDALRRHPTAIVGAIVLFLLILMAVLAPFLWTVDPQAISPTKFHNSVHNAAAGYWTIGAGCTRAATALSAFDASFAQGLVEALAQLQEHEAVLLVGYDGPSSGPLRAIDPSEGLLGGALVLSRQLRPGAQRLRGTLVDARVPPPTGALAAIAGDNAMAPMLPLFEALARGDHLALLHAGPGRGLRLELSHA